MGEIKVKNGKLEFPRKNDEDNTKFDLLDLYKKKYQKIDINKAKNVLNDYFNYTNFKEKQIECLNGIKNFEHILNIMPTGGGKSLIYQIMPLIVDGISIVISPLISLIQDQIKSLRNKNIFSETINSSLNKKENQNILAMLRSFNDCNIKVLYITPETATSPQFISILEELYLNGKISLISIDEVHCISTWGCDFRKSYRHLSKLLNTCPYVRIYSCTATATKHVERDIITNLGFHDSNNNKNDNDKETINIYKGLKIVRTSFNRPNIKYIIIYSDLLKIDKKESICDIVREKRNERKTGIIYCFKRKTCDMISKYLRENGIQSLSYHAGLTNNARKQIQEKWINGTIKILVATIAFGMGIDRKDVSYIIHFNLPKSIENYYQESGRAGRNGNIAFCYLYYSKEDVEKLAFIIKGCYSNLDAYNPNMEKKFEKEMHNLECVHNLCITQKCIRTQILNYFGETYQKDNHNNKDRKSDINYCCSYCFDIKGSADKIRQINNLYQQENWNPNFQRKTNEYNNVASYQYSHKGKKHKLSGNDSDSNQYEEIGFDDYKLSNNRIKGFVPFQKASSIISKDIRAKGIVEVMKELERREEMAEIKLQEKNDRIPKVSRLIPTCVNIKKKNIISSFKVPRKL
ncbi:ATP-dependent DNA helicase Q1, putative [Plasmodium berghei]|uniref:ATP-dependent DNA helicase n=2 Tax=Plasmodium berghei TaxID=5821 RepID=A0A509ANS7_PLABA|nr:ATP-dependent DNA helicase Q1, putative [Plasmodium berghei ANKA]CXI33154.1 ATP-dependent DNA helicase Q1, putative [Plasmodium berghei]SCM21224.1 ATP-dependent DNA helicase Q1, putative [Plasmodium berghei]SCN24534.1 ATP-dependent DNA helicase Q1, putative [Plasmodium berghei]SCO59710.1 ATP-dependent DNA helicase Q1, putative [Plasmodium berghei]SCO60921.1 ATP-dependent DNA helicase Q1, putative [Plasmodium berghei]|eukprot:XP_034421167.1 ATP-dependent DNA helicase Q1, putative [Plasmodium berghei ANKA]